MSRGHPIFLALLEELRELHLKKAADYGDEGDPLQNLRGSIDIGIEPWRAAWLRAKDKVKRIDKFCRDGRLVNEGVEDSFKDLAAYCLLILSLRREDEQREVGKLLEFSPIKPSPPSFCEKCASPMIIDKDAAVCGRCGWYP